MGKSDMIEVLRMASIAHPRKKTVCKNQTSLSNELEAARAALRDDPHNMVRIAKLGLMYAAEHKWSMAMNVMLRGWKRAGEFTDRSLRVAFLAKLAEASYMEGKARQAGAVLHDMDAEPEDRDEKMSLQLLVIHIHAANKNIEQALKALGVAIEGKEADLVVRIWALCSQAMSVAGMFEAAKAVVEGVLGTVTPRSGIQTTYAMDTVQSYVNQLKKAQEESQNRTFMEKMENPDFAFKALVGAGVAIAGITLTWLLYWLEQRSLASMKLGQ